MDKKKHSNNKKNNNNERTYRSRSSSLSSSPSKKKKLVIIAGIVLTVVIITGNVSAPMPNIRSNIQQQQQSTFQSPPPSNGGISSEVIQRLITPSTENAQALGSKAAPITLVEFGDYQCTYCQRFHSDTKANLLANFVDSGKVRFLFKDFPINDLPADRASTLAAEASYCAADQGKYWQYHDQVYDNWRGENTGWVTKSSLKQFAIDVGITDMAKFSQCLDSQIYGNVVMQNYNLAQNIHLSATPSFVLIANNKPQQPALAIVGAQPYSVFANTINQMING